MQFCDKCRRTYAEGLEYCPSCGKEPSPEQRRSNTNPGPVIVGIIGAAIFWIIYQALMRALYSLPAWAARVLFFLFGAALAFLVYRLIFVLARNFRGKGFSRKSGIICYAVIFTAIIPNFLHLPSTEQPNAKGPSSTNIVMVPPKGPSATVIPISGNTKRLVVRPPGSVWVLLKGKLIEPDDYKPFASDNIRFVSKTGKSVVIYAQQFWHPPSPAELTAPLPEPATPRR